MEQESPRESTSENTIAEARRLCRALYKKDYAGFHARLLARMSELQEKHPDYDEYQLYHTAIGSSEIRGKMDFPGEDSLLLWLEQEARGAGI